jgi:hypothetical protein
MTLLARASLGRRWPGPGGPHSVIAGDVRLDTRVPVTGHGQRGSGRGQNGALSSKKTKTGICAQPTMS